MVNSKNYKDQKRISRKVSTKAVYNPANSLYNKLTKFFSGPITKYKSPDITNPTRQSLNKQKYTDMFKTPFKRADDYYLINQYQSERNIEVARIARYIEFETMCANPPEIDKALDIYSGEITCYTEMSPILKIISPKDEIKEILETLFYDTLNIEMNLFGWVRTLCKYGDLFLFLDIDPSLGILGAQALPVMDIQRLEGEDPSNPNYIQFQWNAKGITFENVEIAHFRILGDDKLYPYGSSVLNAARRITQQLNLMVENMITYRVTRAAEKLAFYMDVTGLEPSQVEAYFEKNLSSMQRQSLIDPQTGKMDMRYNVGSMAENYIIPIRKGSETRIEPLPAGNLVGTIDDIEFLRDQLFTSLGIPGSYLTNKNNDGEQTSLAQKSMMFARTILRIQHSVVAELQKIGMVHLLTLGYSGDDLLSFKLRLNNPSKLAEMQEYEHFKQKSEVASALSDHNISKHWIQSNIFNFSPDEINRNTYEILGDAHFQMLLANIENQSSSGDAGGMGGGLGGGGSSGGGGIPGLGDMMQGESPQPGGEQEFTDVPGGDESNGFITPPSSTGNTQGRSSSVNMFMTPAAKRPHVTQGSKGKSYVPRDDNRNQRLNQINTISGRNSIRAINKNIFPGMGRIAKNIYPEGTTNADESLILESEDQIKENLDVLKQTIEDKKELVHAALANYNKNKRLIKKQK